MTSRFHALTGDTITVFDWPPSHSTVWRSVKNWYITCNLSCMTTRVHPGEVLCWYWCWWCFCYEMVLSGGLYDSCGLPVHFRKSLAFSYIFFFETNSKVNDMYEKINKVEPLELVKRITRTTEELKHSRTNKEIPRPSLLSQTTHWLTTLIRRLWNWTFHTERSSDPWTD